MPPDQDETPLYTALLEHLNRNYANLHVPAHRQGKALPYPLKLSGEQFYQLDLTELPGLDNLHAPKGPIARSQELAAKLYGADHTFFLVNGTSVGLQALLLALCRPGEQVIVPRDSHQAILAGLIISGADPVYLYPSIVPEFSVAGGIKAQHLRDVLKEQNNACGVVLVYPNYYGIASDLKNLVELTHQLNKPVVVDEAHGAHLPFNPLLPQEALACGADAVVQSMHKTGGSLTQSSLLHLKGGRLDSRRVKAALSLLQTTSPSYLLMCSLDLARNQLATRGAEMLERSIEMARQLRMELSQVRGIKVLGHHHLEEEFALDPTRITISVGESGLTGYQVAALLAQKYRVQIEMADYYHIVAVTGIGTTNDDCQALIQGIKEITLHEARGGQPLPAIPAIPPVAPKRMPPRKGWFAPEVKIPLKDSAGLICTEWITAYPPGIPVIYPGEEITPETIDYLQLLKKVDVTLTGSADGSLEMIGVIDQ